MLAPELDLTKLDFPTDALTVKQLRQLFPKSFDHTNQQEKLPRIPPLLADERGVAEFAFAEALGRLSPDAQADHYNCKQELVKDYVRYGMATGPQQARQLIRDLEAAAAELARQHMPGKRR